MQSSYKHLAQAGVELNLASDELGKVITILDGAVKKLNLGVSAWVTLSEGENDNQIWWKRKSGYAKVRDKWGIALKIESGDRNDPEEDSEEIWLFNDAPRWMRIEAVGKIPDILDALLQATQTTTKGIRKKTAQALELAAAMNALSEQPKFGEQR